MGQNGELDNPGAPVWDEARGPHLPDWVSAQPAAIWPYVVLAAVVSALQLGQLSQMSVDASNAWAAALMLIRVVAWMLLPAALFLRHPDAWTRLRPLAVGLALLAAAELLQTVAGLLTDTVGWDAAPSPVLAPGYLLGLLGVAVLFVAVLCLWTGLRAARRQPDPKGSGALLRLMAAATLAAILIGAAGLALAGTVYVDNLSVVANGAATVLSALTLLAWVAVASVLLAGARAGEPLVNAWRLGAAGVFVGSVLMGVLSWVLNLPALQVPEIWPAFGWLYVVAPPTGVVLILAAFTMGLPAGEPEPVASPAA